MACDNGHNYIKFSIEMGSRRPTLRLTHNPLQQPYKNIPYDMITALLKSGLGHFHTLPTSAFYSSSQAAAAKPPTTTTTTTTTTTDISGVQMVRLHNTRRSLFRTVLRKAISTINQAHYPLRKNSLALLYRSSNRSFRNIGVRAHLDGQERKLAHRSGVPSNFEASGMRQPPLLPRAGLCYTYILN
ncbi:hypothetical protein EPUS_00934 [Endocarpon pusillum Z07020]|uniref:Uncharacterized protein n=1 Tax=Endocarpon pusillum (strain Z07020 / HMAS-L-300199) TaxID=1263415 RepID=U1GP31_ENDPU|nr:uncharacterized protein EPUS_00934 [Endocarpon pusillum Z07020]ERF73681.1 hypothetical protein EPUS_00934 [Endocarpon pusillum Z07020]